MEKITKQQYLKLLKKTPKYHNKKTDYTNITFHSKKEAGMAYELDMLVYAKKIDHYERQYPFSLHINGKHICYYIADFVVFDVDGAIREVIETKGYFTQVAKLKTKLFKALYPQILFRLQKG